MIKDIESLLVDLDPHQIMKKKSEFDVVQFACATKKASFVNQLSIYKQNHGRQMHVSYIKTAKKGYKLQIC